MKALDTLTDEELVLQAQKGSEAHFNALVDRYAQVVFRVAYGITGRPEEAEDVTQETFLKVFTNIGRFSPSKGSLKTWLLTIARNQSINVFISLKRNVLRLIGEHETEEDYPAHANNPVYSPPQDLENLLATKQEFHRIKKSLEQLPQRQRTALLLKAEEDMSYEEIASIMKTSVSSVESLIFRARKKLLETLEE
ncbi:MAG: RNA polymerase sigma factor [Desulfomonile sp.]